MPKADVDPTDRFVMEVLDGRHDGRFKEIAQAIEKRREDGHTRFVWRITLPDGESWDGRSVTGGELVMAENATKIRWKHLDPSNEMDHFVALVVAHYRKVHGFDFEQAVAKAEALTGAEIEAAVDDYELVSPPKAGVESADSTST